MPRKTRLAFLANPYSGKNTSRAGLSLVVSSILAAPQGRFLPESLEEVSAIAEEIRRRHPEIVVLAGGDGTVQQYLTRIIQRYEVEGQSLPKFLVLPTGTMNNLSTVLGTNRSRPEKLAARIKRKLDHGEALNLSRLRVLRVNEEYGFIYGAGLPVEVIVHYERLGAGGAKNALRTLVEALAGGTMRKLTFGRFGIDPKTVNAVVEFHLTGDEARSVRRGKSYSAILAGTIENVGFGCNAIPEARLSNGFVLRTSTLSMQEIAFLSGPLWVGMPLLDTEDVETDWVAITYTKPTVRLLDGEIKPAALQDILSLGPELQFIVG